MPTSATQPIACTLPVINQAWYAALAAAKRGTSQAIINQGQVIYSRTPRYCNVSAPTGARRVLGAAAGGDGARLLAPVRILNIIVPILVPGSAGVAGISAAFTQLLALDAAILVNVTAALNNAIGSGAVFASTNSTASCASGSACNTPLPTVIPVPTPAVPASLAASSLSSSQQLGLGLGIALPLAAFIVVAIFAARAGASKGGSAKSAALSSSV